MAGRRGLTGEFVHRERVVKGVSGDRRHLLFSANKHVFSLVTVQLRLSLGHPVLNVDIAVKCGF